MNGTELQRLLQQVVVVEPSMPPPPSRPRPNPAPSTKKRRATHSSVSSDYEEGDGLSSSDESHSRARKRARRDVPVPVAAAPPPQQHNDADGDEGTADEFTPPHIFTSLREASNAAMESYINEQLYGTYNHQDCFICDFEERYDKEVKRTAGQVSIFLEAGYAYGMMQQYHRANPLMPPGKKARALTTIYKRHGWLPAVEKNGGVPPPRDVLPPPNVRTMFEHLELYCMDPNLELMRSIQSNQQLRLSLAHKLGIDGTLDSTNARLLFNINTEQIKLVEKQIKLAGDNYNAPFMFDPERVLMFSSTRPLEAIRSQATGDALGGATATNNSTSVNMVTAQRPAFGALSSVAEDEDEDDSDNSSDDSGE